MTGVDPRTRRWKRVEYERLVEAGFLSTGDPVELLDGHLIVAEPQDSRHFTVVRAVEEAFRAAFGPGWEVRGQGPLALDDHSEPEPDVAVVVVSFRDYAGAHPSRPALLVEVSETRLAFDRGEKAALYARAGVDDYWIVNLVDRVVEVYRRPTADAAATFGWRYQAVTVLEPGDALSPLARPEARVRVDDLLPVE